MYYQCIKLYTDQFVIDYWHIKKASPAFLYKAYDLIKPLGTRKPRKIAKENIKHAN